MLSAVERCNFLVARSMSELVVVSGNYPDRVLAILLAFRLPKFAISFFWRLGVASVTVSTRSSRYSLMGELVE